MQETIRNELDAITQAIAKTVKPLEIILFGSYARGEQREDSDIDLCIIVADGGENPFITSMDARESLLGVTHSAVDIVTIPQSLFHERKAQIGTLELEIEREGVVLYAKKQRRGKQKPA